MKMTKFFALALAALTVVSCKKDTNDINPGEEINSPTYATFKFNVGTKAAADFDPTTTAEQDAADSKIGSIQLLIFNASSQALEFNEVVTGANSKTVLLTAGKKKIFFVTNSDKLTDYTTAIAPATFTVGTKTLTDFYALNFSAGTPQQLTVDKNGSRTFNFSVLHTLSAVDKGLPMSNTNEITYTLKGGISETDASGGSAVTSGDSPTNTFKVQLYYMVAKARLILGADVLKAGSATEAKVANVMYSIRNLARATNYVQNVPTAGNPQSFYFNYDKSTKAEFDKEFDYASNINVAATATAGNYLYVPENNHKLMLRGQASYFAIKANYEPVVISAVAYDINEVVKYTKVPLATADAATKSYIYTTIDVEGIASGTYFVNRSKFEEAAWIMKNKKAWDESNRTEAAALIPADSYLSFTGGTSYYRVDLGDGAGADTQYGVLRSNKYDATINKITGPGVPTEEDLTKDPESPVSAKTYIHATIVPAVWSPITQSADL